MSDVQVSFVSQLAGVSYSTSFLSVRQVYNVVKHGNKTFYIQQKGGSKRARGGAPIQKSAPPTSVLNGQV